MEIGVGNFFLLFLELFLESSFGFLHSTFFHVATGDKASFEFVKFTSCSLLGFEDKFDRDNEFVFARLFAEDECVVINKVLDFHTDSVEPSGANIIIEFENCFQGLRFGKIFVDRVVMGSVIRILGSRGVDGKHGCLNWVNRRCAFVAFLKVECHLLLQRSMTLLVMDHVDLVRIGSNRTGLKVVLSRRIIIVIRIRLRTCNKWRWFIVIIIIIISSSRW